MVSGSAIYLRSEFYKGEFCVLTVESTQEKSLTDSIHFLPVAKPLGKFSFETPESRDFSLSVVNLCSEIPRTILERAL